MLAWAWHDDDRPHHLVVVNLSAHGSQARIPLPWSTHCAAGSGGSPTCSTDRVYDRDGDELAGPGLYVDLPPWGAHVLALEPH